MNAPLLGLPWWQWALVAIACAVVFVVARNASARSGKRQEAERLAQRADATHESARTYHEGGP